MVFVRRMECQLQLLHTNAYFMYLAAQILTEKWHFESFMLTLWFPVRASNLKLKSFQILQIHACYVLKFCTDWCIPSVQNRVVNNVTLRRNVCITRTTL